MTSGAAHGPGIYLAREHSSFFNSILLQDSNTSIAYTRAAKCAGNQVSLKRQRTGASELCLS